MKMMKELFDGYENMELLDFSCIERAGGNLTAFGDLSSYDKSGVLKACGRCGDGVLRQLYTSSDNHVGVIAATRLGKTTSYVIPTVVSFARHKKKKSMVISDPKGEIYRRTAATLRAEGYKVKLLNFRDYSHSEYWNTLTPIFRKYRAAFSVSKEVGVTECADGTVRNVFRGKVYDSQRELDADLRNAKSVMIDDVGNDLDNVSRLLISTERTSDPFWEESARDVLKAFLWAMLEDSNKTGANAITEDTFSFSTILRVVAQFKEGNEYQMDDRGYFSSRPVDSMAYILSKNSIVENARATRKGIMSTFMSKVSLFAEVVVRLLTSCNSFDVSEILDGPTVVFIDYRDEIRAHYKLISMFVQEVYRILIEKANDRPDGRLETPFYFILDEFGNFPRIPDFEATISACAGRNIFFMLIVQSYAQLDAVYGADVAEIIRDNLNVHIFFGSNNPGTLEKFSQECGRMTRISPLSALNGDGTEICSYQMESLPLVPRSRLCNLAPGECVVTEANCGYVMLSQLTRYFECDEFKDLPTSSEKDYKCDVNPFDKKYIYEYKPVRS